jgi:peptidoglycan hydrolase-like protein with peptidoglycan-binding domain
MAKKRIPHRTDIVRRNPPKPKANLHRQYLVYGLGAGALLGGGYLLYNYLQDRQAMQRSGLPQVPSIPIIPRSTVLPSSSSSTSSGFPLKRGSRGELVRMLQQALLSKGGAAATAIRRTSMRSNGSPDGVFGGGTESALRAAGLPTVIDRSTFQQISSATASGATGETSTSAIARELVQAANGRNLFATLSALKKIPDVSGYVAVSNAFKASRILGIRVTSLVNGLLSVAFKSNEPGKVKIRAEFRRMGLQQDRRGVWRIPGLGRLSEEYDEQRYRDERDLLSLAVTRKPTLLKLSNGDYRVPPVNTNTVVGYVTREHRGITQLITRDGQTVYAPSQNLQLL